MSSASSRLAGPGYGQFIDRTRPLTFTFDGVLHNGFQGDVIASALYAEGQLLLSRSFKYHRPRGVLTMAGHDANTLVQIAEEPNARADRHRLTDGLAVQSINRWGSLAHDRYAILDHFGRFLPVGFYYKTFYSPKGIWKYFERPIREIAGLGRLEPAAQHKYYDKAYLFTDVLVVGGGPAGLTAAIAAAEAGAETLLIEEWPKLGGSLLYSRAGNHQAAARDAMIAKALATPKLTVLTDTTVSGLFSDNWTAAISGCRLYKIRSRHTIVATGAFDQPLVFPNNDRPGILFADAALRLMRYYGVKPGSRAVIVTANSMGYDAALELADAAVEVAGIVDLSAERSGASVDAARARGLRIRSGSILTDSRGRRRVESVAVAKLNDSGEAAGAPEWITADVVLMSVGYAPALNLASHAGARVVYDDRVSMHRAVDLPQGLSIVGAASGLWSEDRLMDHAAATGAAAANGDAAPALPPVPADPAAATITHRFPILAGKSQKDFVDFDEDLKSADIVNSVKDGYRDIQLVKRYSTAGLGPSQGRHANLNTIRIVARETGSDPAAIGTTTFRPPLVPEKFAHMAGRSFEPVRLTPMHHRHVEAGAQMMVAGLWLRPAYYGAKADVERAITAEVKAVREAVGMIDVSTLGGLDIRGPDAAAFIERMYTGSFAKLAVGRARYAVMTDMAGVVIDDGIAARLHDRHFYVTATSSAIDQVYRSMLWYNAQWRLDVDIANVTATYGGINIAGPRSREVLGALGTDIDLGKDAFPYMAVRTGTIADIPVRILRVGFVGELGFEIHVPASRGEALWDRLMAAGSPVGIKPFGVEAQRVMRLEKGHVIIGQDTDGLTHPVEAGLEWTLGKTKQFFVGKRSIEMQVAKGIARRLVGFRLIGNARPAPKECHLVIRDGEIAGRVTSVTRSPTLNAIIGLAFLPLDMAVTGKRFEIRVDGGAIVTAEVVPTPFYDPDNKRQEL